MNGQVFIMQGIPDCGKTSWVRAKAAELSQSLIVSADKFFYDKEDPNIYRFDSRMLPAAHNECLRDFVSGIQLKIPYIFVDNTNISTWEIAPYYRIAEAFDYAVEIVRIEMSPYTFSNRNRHNVPVVQVFRMWRTMQREELPRHWNVRVTRQSSI